MSDNLLEVKQLSIHFGGLKAVDQVSFELPKGDILGLLGPNGAGKTTCFNAISGIYTPTGGEIYLDGEKTNATPPHRMARKGVGRTFQIVHPFTNISVMENVIVALGGDNHWGGFLKSLTRWHKKEIMERAEEILIRVGLGELMQQRAGLLPLGNLRRLEIARALALNPKLLLLDESFSGLRHGEISQIEELVLQIKETGVSILLIEHNMKVAMSLSDRIVVLDHGSKLAEGLPAEIASNPKVIDAYLGRGDSGNVA